MCVCARVGLRVCVRVCVLQAVLKLETFLIPTNSCTTSDGATAARGTLLGRSDSRRLHLGLGSFGVTRSDCGSVQHLSGVTACK